MCQITFLILGYRNQESQQSLCVLETEKEREEKKKNHRISGNTFYVLKRKINQD